MNYFSIIASVFLIAFGGMELLDSFSILGAGAVAAGMLFAGREIVNAVNNRRPRISLENFDADQAALLKEKFDKAVTDYYAVEDLSKKIKDQQVIEQIKQMQKVSHSMLTYLEKHPNRISSASKFVDYYQDRAVKILNDFHELESTGLATDKVEEQKQKLREILYGIDDAYADQFEKMLREKMLSTEAEIEVMNQQMDSEGIVRKKKFERRDDLPSYGDPDKEFVIEPEIEEEHEWANVSQDRMTNYNMDRVSPLPRRVDRRLPRRRQATFLTEYERSQAIKQKSIMSILAIFFGSFGAHKFYQRKNLQGVLYLFFFWTSIPTWISIAEGIRYIFMPLEDFYIQYVDDD